jgi:hypothetical protein
VNGREPVLSDRETSVDEYVTLQFDATPGDFTGDDTTTTSFDIPPFMIFLIGAPTIHQN